MTGLAPRQTYPFALLANGNTVGNARLTTLPAALPTLGDKPFTVLLGTCFAYHEDQEGKVGNAFLHMPLSANPEIKLFAGDQVYLDSPWYRYLVPHTADELRNAFVEHYRNTWGQTDGFARVLTEGANFVLSDDHEYWNNAPYFVAYASNTWTAGGRTEWFGIARELFNAFQTTQSITRFAVPPVSFLVADTRINRDANRNRFMTAVDLGQVRDWVNGLQGPGVLVIGQALLQGPASFLRGTFSDWNLPDFAQYYDLVRIVGAAAHSLVILTGDVHFGRVAHGQLPSGAELIEIISSPLSLVDRTVQGTWVEAPALPVAPPTSGAPIPLSVMNTEEDFGPTDGHFLTLEFTRRGPGARLRLRYWPAFAGGVPPPDFGKTIFERDLI